tara:strand:+ start:968 stop:1558 length:591 start_codon:yes stop_codon:yes gene_type:complete
MKKKVNLGDIAKVSAGNSAPQEKKLFKKGIYNFVRTYDVGKIKKGILYDSRDKLNKEGIKKLSIVPKGTILFPKSGASTFLNHRVMLGIDAYVASHLATIKANNDIVLDKYLFYFLLIIDAKKLVADSGYPSLKTETIKSIKLEIPNISEQRKVVEKLDFIFQEVENTTIDTNKILIELKSLKLKLLKDNFDTDYE